MKRNIFGSLVSVTLLAASVLANSQSTGQVSDQISSKSNTLNVSNESGTANAGDGTNKILLLYTSDATPLYKGDVFRVLALPDEYCIQFRYPYQFVPMEFTNKISDYAGHSAVVVFVAGNDLTKRVPNRNLTYVPVRECRIRQAFADPKTEQVILILELRRFVDLDFNKARRTDQSPPTKFVAESLDSTQHEVTWLNRVRAVQQYFPSALFYRIWSVQQPDGSVLSPLYSSASRSSHYTLEEETDYFIECSCYNPEKGDARLSVSCRSELADWAVPFETGVGAPSDTRILRLSTRTLKTQEALFQSIFFGATNSGASHFEDPNNVPVSFLLQRKHYKPVKFGGLAALGALGLAVGQFASQAKKWWAKILAYAAALACVGVAAGFLYVIFNKI
jgi:hypothetical protein